MSIELSIDTASDIAGAALTSEGTLISEATWRTRQNHSRELLPTIEWLLDRAALTKADISAAFVCIGPGSYAGLRVGLSTAKGLAYALGIPIVGIGRLEADAAAVAAPAGSRIVAVHAAGRAELAWAVYERGAAGLAEISKPRLGPRDELLAALSSGDIICGEPGEGLRRELAERGAVVVEPPGPRVVTLAALAWERLRRGQIDSTDALVPMYLREPAIGPQRPAAG
jgi:tRNA threonylcarbamoyladenosine biosynthesis protein TsaB